MKGDLDPAKHILTQFLTELAKVEKMAEGISGPMNAKSFTIVDRQPVFDGDPDFSRASILGEEEEAYIWSYLEPRHPRSLMHRPESNPIPEYFIQPAIHLYDEWLEQERDIINRGVIIPPPENEVSLIDYLNFLKENIYENCETRAIWITSLKSFNKYLIEDIPDKSMLGWLEGIFPLEMDFQDYEIFEKTADGVQKVKRRAIFKKNSKSAVYPIDIYRTSEIIKNLLAVVLNGRSNSQRSAAEALGFALVCHAAAAAGVSIEEKELYAIKTTDLIAAPLEDGWGWFKPEYFISLASRYGNINVPISKWLYDYLLALPRPISCEEIFSSPWGSVYRSFIDKGVLPAYGNDKSEAKDVTFLTFMSCPHHAIGHRHSRK